MTPPKLSLSVVALLVAGVTAAVVVTPAARSQAQGAPSYVPIGVSSSGNTSTVWFDEPSSRQTLACQTVIAQAPTPSSIQCVAAKLP